MTEYGTEIDIVGPTATVEGEHGYSVDTDFLIEDMTNVSDYDYMYVPGGYSPENLMLIPEALSLVVEAYNEGLVMAAICAGPILFAAADIISGRNISGNIAIESDVISAGANFIYAGTIVIDGPFVTADYARMYDFAQRGILKALGLFESDPPELVDYLVNPVWVDPYGSVSIVVEVNDYFNTKTVIALLYRFIDEPPGVRIFRRVQLSRNANNTIYSNVVDGLPVGNFSLWFEVEDVLGNNYIYEYETGFYIGDTSVVAGVPLISLLLIIGASLGFIFTRRRKK
jgi:protease I